jgi:hypothetical protein
MTAMKIPSCLVTALLIAASAQAGVIYVDAAAVGANNGASWFSAFKDLRVALSFAQAGDEVRIAQGIYKPDQGSLLRSTTFPIGSGVSLKGGYAGIAGANPDLNDPALFVTVLTGDLLGNDGPGFTNRSDNAFHVVTVLEATSAVIVQGLTVRGGQADGPTDASGAGLLVLAGQSDVAIDAVVFTDNHADSAGAGLLANTVGEVVISNSRFEGNSVGTPTKTSAAGGGLYLSHPDQAVVTHCVFRANIGRAASGGKIRGVGAYLEAPFSPSTVLVSGSLFASNVAEGPVFGVGLFFAGAVVTDCVMRDNECLSQDASGGGGASTSGTLMRCSIYGNRLPAGTGAGFLLSVNQTFSSPVMLNCLVVGNQSAQGAVDASLSGGTIRQCTIAFNTATGTTAGLVNDGLAPNDFPPAQVKDSILWANTAAGAASTQQAQYRSSLPAAFVNFSCVQGLSGALGGTGNIGADPLFTDALGADGAAGTPDDDLSLPPGSPCIDSGSPASPLDPDGTIADMGALPFNHGAPFPTWVNKGHSLAGSSGTPALAGTGTLFAATPVSLSLASSPPFALAWLVTGLTEIDLPFKDGVFVPHPDIIQPFVTSAAGTLLLAGTWPAAVPSSAQIFFQVWVLDPPAPSGFAASNGLQATTP